MVQQLDDSSCSWYLLGSVNCQLSFIYRYEILKFLQDYVGEYFSYFTLFYTIFADIGTFLSLSLVPPVVPVPHVAHPRKLDPADLVQAASLRVAGWAEATRMVKVVGKDSK